MTAANATEHTEKCLTLTDGEDTNRPTTNAYKQLDQLLAIKREMRCRDPQELE